MVALLERSQMSKKTATKPKLTDTERHKRFVEMAKQVGASDDPKDFEKAFKKITSRPPSNAALKSRKTTERDQ